MKMLEGTTAQQIAELKRELTVARAALKSIQTLSWEDEDDCQGHFHPKLSKILTITRSSLLEMEDAD